MPKPPHRHLLETLTHNISSSSTLPSISATALRRSPPISDISDAFLNLLSPSNSSPPVSFFNKLINSCILSNRLSDARIFYSHLKQSRLLLTNPSYSILLKLQFLFETDSDLPYTILGNMVKSGCRPDAITYSTLISGLCRVGRIEEAWGVVDRMVEENCPPTVRCYTSIVLGYCNDGRVDKAEGLIDKMSSFGCPPDDVTYTILIGALCRREEFAEVDRVLRESRVKGWRPNEVTYNVYINGLCKAGKANESRRQLDIMRENGLCPTMETLHMMFDCFCRDSSGESLQQLGCLLDWDVDVYFYNTLMSRLQQTRRWKDVLKLWASMLKRGIEPDICTYTIAILSFCKKKMLGEAKYIFYHMDFEPDVVAFNALLLGFYRERMFNEVSLLCDMVGKNITPNEFTYCVLIDGFCREKRFLEAVNCYQESIRNRFFPTLITRPVRWLVKDGKLMEALNLFEQMLDQGFILHGFVFDSLIRAFCKKGLCQSVDSDLFFLIFDKMLGIR